MQGKALALVLILATAGCVQTGADVDPNATSGAGGPLVGLTEDAFGFGELLAENVASFDGVGIHVDVQLPDGEGPFPTLIQYTPYSSTLNPDDEVWGGGLLGPTGQIHNGLADYYVPKGYAVGIAHVRGSGQSGGCFSTGGPEEAMDGYALVEWIANQTWSNGKVALMGTSYVGTTPISTATRAPPHLTTIVPVSAVSEWYRYYYENGEPRFFGELPFGVVYTDHPLWAATGLVPKPRNPTAADPLANAQCGVAQMENAWLQDDYNDYWMDRNYVRDIHNATTPMLYAHGFLDENTPTSLVTDFYDAYPGEKRLWMQQHGHGVPASFESYHLAVHRWLDFWMLDRNNGALDMPAVILQDNRGQYHVEADWPPANATWEILHLGEGQLLPDAPAEGSLSYTDEARAMDEFAGPREGSFLQFDSEPLPEDLHVSGAPRVELVAASDKTDTQFDVLLYDVAPDGTAAFLSRGYLDARHRESLTRGVDVTPGAEELYVITMHGRDHHVDAGHFLRLVVVSTEEYVVPDTPGATNTILLGPAGSRLVLPTLVGSTFGEDAPFGAS